MKLIGFARTGTGVMVWVNPEDVSFVDGDEDARAVTITMKSGRSVDVQQEPGKFIVKMLTESRMSGRVGPMPEQPYER